MRLWLAMAMSLPVPRRPWPKPSTRRSKTDPSMAAGESGSGRQWQRLVGVEMGVVRLVEPEVDDDTSAVAPSM